MAVETVAYDDAGDVIDTGPADFTRSTSDPDVALVNAQGVVTPVSGGGSVMVEAECEGVSGSVEVVIDVADVGAFTTRRSRRSSARRSASPRATAPPGSWPGSPPSTERTAASWTSGASST